MLCTALTLTLFLFSPNCPQQKTSRADALAALVQESTKSVSDSTAHVTAIWFPTEYFRLSLEEKGKYSSSEIDSAVAMLNRYCLFAVLAGKFNDGVIQYEEPEAVKSKLLLSTSAGKEFAALADLEVPGEIRSQMASLRSSLFVAMGPLAKNFSFVFFSSTDSEGKNLLTAQSKGGFMLQLRDFPESKKNIQLRWKTPLESLLPKKACPKCHEECQGSWSYCPWDGSRL